MSRATKLVWKEDSVSSELNTPTLRISVHRSINHPPTTWLLSCYDLRIDRRVLQSFDLEDAKREAIEVLRLRAERILNELESVQLKYPT